MMSMVASTEMTLIMATAVVMMMVVYMMETSNMMILEKMALAVTMTRMPIRIVSRMRMEHQDAHGEKQHKC